MAVNYVRFLRGTPNAYRNLSVKNQDTLYFISEVNATEGVLYLGDKLITGLDASNINIALENLSNVIWDGSEGQILVSDDAGHWEAKDPKEVLESVIKEMTGATAETDGKAGLVPQPKKGDQVKFLRGDGTWAQAATKGEFDNLHSTVMTLIGEDVDQNGSVTKSIRDIANEELTKQLIPVDAKESLDTLKEIADWIQDHPDDASNFNTRILKIENTLYDTENPDWTNNLEGLITVVSNMQTQIDALDPQNITDLQYDVGILYDKLRWHDMNEADGSEL